MAKSHDQFDERFERKQEQKKRQLKEMPGEDEAPLPPPVEPIKKEKEEPGRNDPCPCGSGKKYKQCCLSKEKKKGWFGRWRK